MFLVLVNYVKPLEEVDTFLTDHRQFLDKFYAQGKLVVSGRRSTRTGGVILMKVENLSEVQSIIAEDPFHQHGVADYEVIEFTPTKFDPRFATFLE